MRAIVNVLFRKLVAFICFPSVLAFAVSGPEEFLVTKSEPGTPGGKLVIAERSEPKTLNPITALDGPSRNVIRRMIADLISINRSTQRSEPALAKSWTISADKHPEASTRHQVFRRPCFRCRRRGLFIPGVSRREGPLSAAGLAGDWRQADRRDQTRPVHRTV